MNQLSHPIEVGRARRVAAALATGALAAMVTACSGSDPTAANDGATPGVTATSVVVFADGSTSIVVVPAEGAPGSPSAATGSAAAGATTLPAGSIAAPAPAPDITQAPATPAPSVTEPPPPAPAVTVAAPPAPAPETIPPATVSPATGTLLSSVGVGQYAFGQAAASMLPDLVARFGEPMTDASKTFFYDGERWIDELGEFAFDRASGRELCFANRLCVILGGDSPDLLALTGWSYEGDETGSLRNPAGITIGSRWSDFPTQMTVDPGGCFTIGSGRTNDGITLTVQGGDFQLAADDGTLTTLVPPPEQVTVVRMSAGTTFVDLFGDC